MKYSVETPLAGSITLVVEAENESAAKEAAWERINETIDTPDLGEASWEYLDAIVSGNVCHAPCKRINVEEM